MLDVFRLASVRHNSANIDAWLECRGIQLKADLLKTVTARKTSVNWRGRGFRELLGISVVPLSMVFLIIFINSVAYGETLSM